MCVCVCERAGGAGGGKRGGKREEGARGRERDRRGGGGLREKAFLSRQRVQLLDLRKRSRQGTKHSHCLTTPLHHKKKKKKNQNVTHAGLQKSDFLFFPFRESRVASRGFLPAARAHTARPFT